jgi:D-ornithine 4,5-aminomutase subunit alpha
MGISSQETKPIVEGCMDRGLMGKGAGHVVYRLSQSRHISVKEAGALLARGQGWDEVTELFQSGKG